jgi:hypothetical protein
MSPFLWLLWAVCAFVLLVVITAMVFVIRDSFLAHKPCPRCGYEPGVEDTYIPTDWPHPGDIDEGPPVR